MERNSIGKNENTVSGKIDNATLTTDTDAIADHKNDNKYFIKFAA